MRRPDIRLLGMVLLLALIVAVDAASPRIVLLPFTVVPVLLASTFASARQTAWLGGLATAAAIGLGLPDREFGSADHAIRTGAVAVIVGFAVYAAAVRQARESELRHQALHDELTGLANRALLADRLHQILLRRRPVGLVAVLFLDIDKFKSINDTHGHDAGDAVLRHVADCLHGVTRAGDTLARFAGDEFVLICGDLPEPAEATGMARRLRAALATPVSIGVSEITVSASIGIAVAAADTADGVALLRAADAAMFEVKRRGGDDYALSWVGAQAPPAPTQRLPGRPITRPPG